MTRHLYHGTAAANLDSILQHGLRPRDVSPGNWDHTLQSRSDCVYLTSIYAPYFGLMASGGADFALIEINLAALDPASLLPDEDFLEQATRRDPDEMESRTRFFRDNLEEYAHHWKDSLRHLGTCCHLGIIPPESIRRSVVVDVTVHQDAVFAALNPTITLANCRFCGDEYRGLTSYFMECSEVLAS